MGKEIAITKNSTVLLKTNKFEKQVCYEETQAQK